MKSSNFDILVESLRRYCTFQDRSPRDISLYMNKLKMPNNQRDIAVKILKDEGFYDEKRYANSFVSGKIKYNKWGRIKIKAELYLKKIENSIIEEAINNIDEKEYNEILESLIEKKILILKSKNEKDINSKLIRYAISKGFEYDLIKNIINNSKK